MSVGKEDIVADTIQQEFVQVGAAAKLMKLYELLNPDDGKMDTMKWKRIEKTLVCQGMELLIQTIDPI